MVHKIESPSTREILLREINTPSKMVRFHFALAIITALALTGVGIGALAGVAALTGVSMTWAVSAIASGVVILGVVSFIEASLRKPQRDPTIFGKAEWEKYFGKIEEEPPVPATIKKYLNSKCPYHRGKKVRDTHMLVLIPKTVKGKPFSLDVFKRSIQYPQDVVKKTYGAQANSRSYWVLMTRDVVPDSRGKSYYLQKQLVAQQKGYRAPKLVEVVTCTLAEHACTGKRLFSDNPWTYTRCQEQINDTPVMVGSFNKKKKLSVLNYDRNDGMYGMAACRGYK